MGVPLQASYILLNPTNEYAVRIIRAAQKDHGLRPVVVWGSAKEAYFWRQHVPILRTDAVWESFYLDQTPVAQLAALLSKVYDIRGVIAYQEQTMQVGTELGAALGLPWNDPATLRRFRDKNGLKTYLRAAHPEIPIEATRQVRNVDEVLAEPLPERFVIKPNDGMANRDIGFFDRTTPRRDLEAYFATLHGTVAVLETFLEGPEYAVNGQMDAQGRAHVLNVTQYDRVPGNGKPNLYRFCCHVGRGDPAFQPLARYAAQVMEATGLRRAPFHMELILTAGGPQLIEVGARLGGLDYVFITNAVHDGQLDAFALATHYWLSEADYRGAMGNWDYYDAINFVQLDGISTAASRLYRVEGMQQIAAHPWFFAWVFRPRPGQLLHKTVDLFTIPYSFQFRAKAPRDTIKQAALQAETALRLNHQVGAARRAYVEAQALASRLRRRLLQEADQAVDPWRRRWRQGLGGVFSASKRRGGEP